MHLCSMTEKSVAVKYKGKIFHFDFVTMCGWIPVYADGSGSTRKNHPKGAWEELKRLHDPKMKV